MGLVILVYVVVLTLQVHELGLVILVSRFDIARLSGGFHTIGVPIVYLQPSHCSRNIDTAVLSNGFHLLDYILNLERMITSYNVQ